METLTVSKIQKLVIPSNNFKLLEGCKADTKDGREALTYLNFREGGIIEATDGRILVRTKLDISIPAGVYRIIGTEKNSKTTYLLTLESVDINYPNTENVIPKETEEKLSLLIQKKQVHACTIVRIYNFNKSVVSEKYLETMGELNTEWNVFKTEASRALLFKPNAYETTVVLMPLAL